MSRIGSKTYRLSPSIHWPFLLFSSHFLFFFFLSLFVFPSLFFFPSLCVWTAWLWLAISGLKQILTFLEMLSRNGTPSLPRRRRSEEAACLTLFEKRILLVIFSFPYSFCLINWFERNTQMRFKCSRPSCRKNVMPSLPPILLPHPLLGRKQKILMLSFNTIVVVVVSSFVFSNPILSSSFSS